MYKFLLFFLFSLLAKIAFGDVPCRLQFVGLTSESKLTSDAVQITPEDEDAYIARIEENGAWIGGRLTKDLYAIASKGGVLHRSNSFELLTNPSNCSLRWSSTINEFTVEFQKDSYLGRIHSTAKFLAGNADSNNIYYIDENLAPKSAQKDIYYLESYSKGLLVTVQEFKMDTEDIPNQVEFLGIDVINNDSPAVVKQSVSHKKKITQKTSVQSTDGTTFSNVFSSVKMQIQLSFNGAGGPVMDLSQALSEGSQGPVGTTEEKEIVTEREVEVPDYTAVHICSTMSIAENFVADYTAKAVATGVGLTPTDVLRILTERGETGWTLENQGVVKGMTGIVSGTVALSSQFTVVPTTSRNGCLLISKLIRENKSLKQQKTKDAANTIKENVHQLKKILNIL